MTINDIRTKTYFLTSTNSTSFPDATLIVEANNALDRVTSLIMQSDGRWQWDDENQTDLPLATTALVASQQDYTLAVSHLQITRVEVKDKTSNWHKLRPIDETDIYDQSLTDYLKAPGLPMFYDKIGQSFFLYPAPDYSQAASLKIWFKRGPSYFATSDTTKTPGFNSLYHDLIPLWIAYNFAIANGKSNGNALLSEIQAKEDALKDDYSMRDKDNHIRLQARPMRWN
jgi:hypothetical protein